VDRNDASNGKYRIIMKSRQKNINYYAW